MLACDVAAADGKASKEEPALLKLIVERFEIKQRVPPETERAVRT